MQKGHLHVHLEGTASKYRAYNSKGQRQACLSMRNFGALVTKCFYLDVNHELSS